MKIPRDLLSPLAIIISIFISASTQGVHSTYTQDNASKDFDARIKNIETINPNDIRPLLGKDSLTIEGLFGIGKLRLKSIELPSIPLKTNVDTFYYGLFDKISPPYYAAGPYYFFSINDSLYLLNSNNLIKLSAPFENEVDVLYFTEIAMRIRGFAYESTDFVYSKEFKPGMLYVDFKFPISESKKIGKYYYVKLITYSEFVSKSFYSKELILSKEGEILGETKTKEIITLGPGWVY